ncbi:MAG: hypothetical protein ACLFN5_07105 [bacterium]
MSSLEIIALLVVIVGLLEFLCWVFKPQLMLSFARYLYTKTKMLQIICLIGAAVVFYFLTLEITIVEIVAAFIFAGFLMGVGIAPVGPRVIEIVEQQINKNRFWSDYALLWIIWFGLSVWTVYAIFW